MGLGSMAAVGSAIAGAVASANKGKGKRPSRTSSKGSASSGSINYNKGNGYNGRETAYSWKDGTTTSSNATNWRDAAKEAGKEGVGLIVP